MKKITLFLLFLMSIGTGYAQTSDSISYREVYNFDVGDEFHYYAGGGKTTSHSIEKVLTKQYSADNDSVYYSIYLIQQSKYLNMAPYFIKDTIVVKYGFLLNGLEEKYYRGNTKKDTCYSSIYCTYKSDSIYSTTYNNRKGYQHIRDSTYEDTVQNRTYYLYSNYSIYVVGIGNSYYYNTNNYGTINKSLVYYKKGSETWGTPNVFNTGISHNLGINMDKLLVYPNPTYGNLTIQVPEEEKINTISIFSVQGKLIKSEKTGNPNIDISELPKGIYILSGVFEDGTFINQKITKE